MWRFLTLISCFLLSFCRSEIPSNSWSQTSSNFALDQKTCFGVQIGYDYLLENMGMIFE